MTRARDTSQTQDNSGLAVAPYVAGKNFLINGGFDIWQRGTSIGLTGTIGYTADRWSLWETGAGLAATVSRQTTSDTTNLPNIQYCARVQRNSGNTDTNFLNFTQTLETVNSIPLASKTVTVSFYARKGANFSSSGSTVAFSLNSNTTTDATFTTQNTGSTTVASGSITLSTTWQRFTATGTVPSNATQLSIQAYFQCSGTAGAADYWEIAGAQLELGSVPTPFSRAGGSIGGELALCQRYLPAFRNDSALPQDAGLGYAYGTNGVLYILKLPVTARTVPTGLTVIGNIYGYGLNTQYSITPSWNSGTVDHATFTGAPTITSGQGSRLQMAANSALLFTGCEL